MDIFSNIVRVARVTIDEINKPESYIKGDAFEDYIRTNLFLKDRYDILQRTHDYTTNKEDFVENTKEPDFKFRSIKTGEEFFVEAKYRSAYYEDAIEWCKPYQLKRYKEIDQKTPVYITIGVGKESNSPSQIFFIPLKDIKYTKLNRSFLKDYEVSVNSPIDYRLLNRNDKTNGTVVHVPKIERRDKTNTEQREGTGFCIRCGTDIKLDPMSPYCSNCYKSWKILSNKEYEEKYCHICGKEHNSMLLKPTCYDCYKSNKNKLEFPLQK
jgi:hypothetical protein